MELLKKHADAIAVIFTILSCMIWINGKFNSLETDMAIMKTVLIMKNVMPPELAKCKEVKEK